MFLAIAGGFDMISGIFRGVIWHQTIPDSMRGRLAGIEMLSYSIGPFGGQLRSGLVADLTTSERRSSAAESSACWAWPRQPASCATSGAYDARTDQYAVRQRNLRSDKKQRRQVRQRTTLARLALISTNGTELNARRRTSER